MYLASDLPHSGSHRECEEGDGWTRQIYGRSEHGAYHLTIGGTRHFDFTDYAALFSPVLRMSGVLGTITAAAPCARPALTCCPSSIAT
jgi:hypothetical protein